MPRTSLHSVCGVARLNLEDQRSLELRVYRLQKALAFPPGGCTRCLAPLCTLLGWAHWVHHARPGSTHCGCKRSCFVSNTSNGCKRSLDYANRIPNATIPIQIPRRTQVQIQFQTINTARRTRSRDRDTILATP